ncbi:MAG: hypothetical protein PHV76_06200 [Bacteroidales bacterium]|nr:hypothetical protein [Bacteroidales bacterium]
MKQICKPETNTLNTETNSLMWLLIVMIIINILAMVFKFFLDRKLKKIDITIKRKTIIAEKAINIEAELFVQLEKLKLFQNSEKEEMLNSIIKIEEFIVDNKINIGKEIQKTTNKQLDYYKTVCHDFKNKNIKLEKKFTNKFCELYYGE